MATINFTIPEEIKDTFDRERPACINSAEMIRLVRQTVVEADQQRQREAVFRELTAGRLERPALPDAELCLAREYGRP